MEDRLKGLGQCHHIDALRDIDIEEVVTPPEGAEDTAADGGEVEVWMRPERFEKVKLRRYITYVIMLFWVFWTVTGLVRFCVTGDVSLLIISPVMISIPLLKMLRYYFGND